MSARLPEVGGSAVATRRVRAAFPALLRSLGSLRPNRRLRPTGAGSTVLIGSLLVGLAAVQTGNNLLHLLFGCLTGVILTSGILSERSLRALRVRHLAHPPLVAGIPSGMGYRIEQGSRFLAAWGLELREEGLPGSARIPRLDPGASVVVSIPRTLGRRGCFPCGPIVLSTTYPFGLFVKERLIPGTRELLVRPRADRPVQLPAMELPGGASEGRQSTDRGDHDRSVFAGLVPYREGDDARNIHWRSTARSGGTPQIRRFGAGLTRPRFRIVLDGSFEPGEEGEEAIEIAASMMRRGAEQGWVPGFQAPGFHVDPGDDPVALERTLDFLAGFTFDPRLPIPVDPPGPDAVIRISNRTLPRFRAGPRAAPRAEVRT